MGALPEPERLGQDSVVLWIVGAGYRKLPNSVLPYHPLSRVGAESAVFVVVAALGVCIVQRLRLVVPRGVIIHVMVPAGTPVDPHR